MNTNFNAFADSQLLLIDVEPQVTLACYAAARNLYGSLCERIAVAALGLRRLKISGSFAACYDAQGPANQLYEIKSVRRGGGCPIWCWRMQKDLEVAKLGHEIFYVFVTHNAKGAMTSDALWMDLSRTVRETFIVPVADVAKIHAASPFGGMKLGVGSSGYDRPGYRDGYRRVSLKAIREVCHKSKNINFDVAGHWFNVDLIRP